MENVQYLNMSSDSPAGGGPDTTPLLLLAGWSDRFFAWLIDFVIVQLVLWALFTAASFPFWFDGGPDRWFSDAGGAARWAVTSLAFLGYWTYFESSSGQSLGKMALKIKTTDLNGSKADIRSVVIESFGKSFLLPVDLILGWIFSNDKRQRIFGKAASTIVIKVGEERTSGQDVRYTKD
jgi:uncharacterized RDD family membrane protein YckC